MTHEHITAAFVYLDGKGIPIPPDIILAARLKGIRTTKAAGDLDDINAEYHDAISEALIAFFEGGSVAASRNAFNRATVEAFGEAFDAGWVEGGQELPFTGDALEWFNARLEQEIGYISMLFQEAKQLRKEEDFDFATWTNTHADSYTRTLRELFNTASLWAKRNMLVTFTGDDGEESCETCQSLKGKRHKVSWFINRNYVPPFGTGLECHPGRRCQHYLENDAGEQVTI